MKVVDDSLRDFYQQQKIFVVDTYEDFQKYKHTNALIFKSNYLLFMNQYAMADDDVFERPEQTKPVQTTPEAFDPYKDLNEKNKLLAELKAKNVLYRKDPTMIPVKVGTQEDIPTVTLSAKDVVERTFQ